MGSSTVAATLMKWTQSASLGKYMIIKINFYYTH